MKKIKNMLENRKGVVGLEILLTIVSMLFVIGILVMAFTIAGAKLQESVAENSSASLTNSTMTTVDEKGEYPSGTSASLDGCAFTVSKIYKDLEENGTGALTNSTFASVINETSTIFPPGTNDHIFNCALTITEIYNESSGHIIDSTNWTLAGCGLTFAGGAGDSNNSAWNVTGTYTYENDTNKHEIPSTNYTVAGCVVSFSATDSGDATNYNNSNWNITGSYTYELYGEAITVINETKVALQDVPGWFSTYIVMASIVVIILLVVVIINAVRGGGLMGGDRGA